MCDTCDQFDRQITEATAEHAWRVVVALEDQKDEHIRRDHPRGGTNVNVSGNGNEVAVFGGNGSANVNITGNGNIFTGSGNIFIRRGQ